ncbi:hypothetical protein G7Y79_00007g022580 [Physcia stellaris]|nr:hypothetical protein G7Y79_00007g022580 [Physcia stellaris]
MKLPLLSAAALATVLSPSLAHPNALSARGNTIATGLFDVYKVAGCASFGLVVEVKEYTLDNGGCHDTPPNPTLPLLPFLSFRAGVQGGVPAGKQCYFDIYAGKGCSGNYMGFMSMDENNRTCQEVLVGTTGTMPTVGARSARMSCFSA